ncbi:MlaD family protein [Paraconexibacter sp.]|uniref:MlaD family protein n=1 Tax=Paraconexibacter sp. TaxID=2949640 RepID=UPI003563A5A9
MTGGQSTRTIGAITAILGLIVTAVIFSGVFRAPFAPGTRTVSANFERAPQLRTGSQVRLEGNVEGKVSAIEPGPTGREVRVEMKIENDAGPIYKDATARLGFKTLLGGVFYIDLQRGTAAAGPLADSVIPLRNTTVQSEIEDVTTAIRGDAVSGLRTLPGELATGLSDGDSARNAFGTLTEIAPNADRALNAVRGREAGDDLPQLIHAAGKTVAALDSDTDRMKTLVEGAALTLDTTNRRSAELAATLDAAPSATYDMTTTFARLDRTLGNARSLVRRLRPAAGDVAPTLARLRPTLVDTAGLLEDAQPLTRVLPATVRNLVEASSDLGPLVKDVGPALERVDKTILPYLHREDPGTGKSTTVMIGGFLAGFGAGSAGQKDANGQFIRFPASVGASSVYLPCKSSLTDPDAASLLACDRFSDALASYLNYLPKLGPTPQRTTKKGGR